MDKTKLTDFYNAFETPRNFFTINGLSLFAKSDQSSMISVKSKYFWFQFIGLVICSISETTSLLLTFAQGDSKNFIKIIESIVYTGFAVLSVSKVLIFFVNRNSASFIIKELQSLFPKTFVTQEKYKVREYIQHTNYLIRFFSVLYMLLIWMFNLLPIGDSVLTYIHTGVWKRQLPYHFWYPFDKHQLEFYIVTFIFEIWGAFNAASAAVAVNILFCAIISQICMQFTILQRELISLDIGDGLGNDCRDLRLLIQKHQRLIDLSKKMEYIFAIPLLFNYFASTFLICLSGFMAMVTL